MAEKRVSVFELCVSRAVAKHGRFRGGSVGGRQAAFVVEWGEYVKETGDDPGTGRGFARWAHVSPQTAANRLNEFRELFPEDETPAKLAGYMTRRRSLRETQQPASRLIGAPGGG